MSDDQESTPPPAITTTTHSPPSSPTALLASHAQLSYLIPSLTSFSLPTFLSTKDDHDSSSSAAAARLSGLSQRKTLFFDETVPVLFILKTPAGKLGGNAREDDALHAALGGVRIALEAAVVNTAAAGTPGQGQTTPGGAEDVIFSGGSGGEEPVVIFEQDEDGDEGDGDADGDNTEGHSFKRWAYAAWTIPVFLQRPRMRLQEPSIVFRASATFHTPSWSPSSSSPSSPLSTSPTPSKIYLTPGRPSSINLLAALAADPTTFSRAPVPPHLTATRVSRVAPMTQHRESSPHHNNNNNNNNNNNDAAFPSSPTSPSSFQIPVSPETLALPAHPAVQTRMRLSRHNASAAALPPARAGIIAVIEVDVTPHAAECEILLDAIELRIHGAAVANLSADVPGLAFPLRCVAHDHLTFLYRLTPTDLDPDVVDAGMLRSLAQHQLVRELDITVRATALVSTDCGPNLVMNWSAPVDFTPPVNPGYGTATQPLNRPRRPSQLSFANNNNSFSYSSNATSQSTNPAAATLSLISPSVTRPDALPALDEAVAAAAARTTELAIPDLGITMAFSAPDGPLVRVGEEFVWSVYVVNRPSARPAGSVVLPPRKLALVALLPFRRPTTTTNPPTSTTTATTTTTTTSSGLGNRPQSSSSKPMTTSKKPLMESPIADAVVDQASVFALQRSAQLELADVVCLSADARVGPLLPGACQVVELRFVALKEGILGVEAIRVIDLVSQEHVDVRELPVMVVEPARG